MNDSELDRLLDAWEAPAPPPSLREDLRARFPRGERRRFARPLRGALAIAAASAALAIALGQGGGDLSSFGPVRVLNQVYENLLAGFEAWRASSLVARIRQSDPRVYVDGQLVAPLEYGHAATINVHVPGEGVYSIISFPGLTGWVEAGHIHGNVIEFQAGGKQVRIECNRPLVDSDRPVFARRRQ